jgi:serine/threonine protein kinase
MMRNVARRMLRCSLMAGPSNVCSICGSSYDGDALFCPKDGAPLGSAALPQPDPYIGAELGAGIRIEKLIGVGSMGRIYRALESSRSRVVAVKILHKELSDNAMVVARFEREAQIAARLSHPNVIQVFGADRAPPNAERVGGALYIVMEYLDGISLRSALAGAAGALPLVRALRIALQLCDGVGEAHAQGIVHRDLKPENVMLLQRGRDGDFVKVLDFGMARLPVGSAPAVTKAGLIFGTARYISPEGAAGLNVGPSADVYSISTILYQMLAGRTPFQGATSIDVLSQQMHAPPPPLTSFERARDVPPRVVSTIMESLSKRPDDRRPDARALGRELASSAQASGLRVDELWLPPQEAGADRPRPLSGKPTRPMQYPAALAAPPARAEPRPEPSRTERTEPRPEPSRSERTEPAPRAPPPVRYSDPVAASFRPSSAVGRRVIILAFLGGCIACGALMAVIGALAWRASPDPSMAPSTSDRADVHRSAGDASTDR